MSFLFKNIGNNSQLPNADVPKGVNLKYTSFGKQKEEINDGYNNAKIINSSTSKTKANTIKSGRPGAGWEDDDEDSGNNFPQQNINTKGKVFGSTKQATSMNAPTNTTITTKNLENNLYSVQTLSELNIEHEIKIISDVIQPQGARIKPQDNILITFGKACESLSTEIVGSILISNLTVEVAWIILMKTLYAVEFLIKNYPKYYKYFQAHKAIFSDLIVPFEENQAAQANNLSNNILAILENQKTNTAKVYQDELLKKNMQQIQENSPNDLLDLGGKIVNESNSSQTNNKTKLNAFDLFNNNNSNNKSQQINVQNKTLNIVQSQTIDILENESPQNLTNNLANLTISSNVNEQNSEQKKRKFDFISKEKKKETNNNFIQESKPDEQKKQNKFDPFSLVSTTKPAQEKPIISNQTNLNLNNNTNNNLEENKKKKFDFIKKKETNDNNPLLDLNINSQIQPPTQSSDNLLSFSLENKNVHFTQSKEQIQNPMMIPHTTKTNPPNPTNINMNTPGIGPNNNPQQSSNRSALDQLYANYPMPNLNPMLMNLYYAQMNAAGYMMPMNMMNMSPMNMNPMNMNSMNMNMNSINYPMNMMNPMMGTPMMGGGNMNSNMGYASSNNGNVDPNANNPEKKEKKKVIDESAFDFIKLE